MTTACWYIAGYLGIDPRPFSYRQLVMMQDGRRDAELTLHFWRQNDAWDQTTNIVAKIHNLGASFCNGEAKTPDQLNPTLNAGDTEEDPAIRVEQDRVIAERRARIAAERAAKEAEKEAGNGKQD